ncbi:MAG TPA: PaaI family thioesterase [Thermoanaerobaculia bacterium]|nr:PaaI family thioesterase [Thermoanaerobaculia bacterium]
MTPISEPRDPDFRTRVTASFARQSFMATLGASLQLVEPGEVHIALPFAPHLSQQHGYLHAEATTAIADTASGYAALTLTPADAEVLSVEFKINLLLPASAPRFLARGRVIRPGRRLSVCLAEVVALHGAEEEVIASMLSTISIRPG